MKATSLIKKALATTLAAVLISVYTLAVPASAIVYDGVNPGTNYPAFNVFTNTPSEGDESDFFRGKEETSTAASVNNVQSACANGTRYVLRVMVHNGANQSLNNNGSGSGIAKNTKVRVDLKNEQPKAQFPPTATISASNATTVSDNMTINCANGKTVKMSYVPGTAKQFTGFTGTTAISDSVVSSGAAIGTKTPNGDVWGCFDQRVWVTLVVKVEDIPKPPPPPEKPKESLGECKLVEVTPDTKDNHKVTAKVTGSVTNAQIVGYKIDWGDGTTSNKQEDNHTYAENKDKKTATYIITTSVQVKLQDGTVVWKNAENCKKQVVFEAGKPPKVTPPPKTPPKTPAPKELIHTGPAGVAAAFVGVTGLSTFLYNRFGRRFGL
jgi:hypothetical protein